VGHLATIASTRPAGSSTRAVLAVLASVQIVIVVASHPLTPLLMILGLLMTAVTLKELTYESAP
jgi:hypothetical protein